MKRIFAFLLIALVSAALFSGLVYGVLLAAHVAEPTATTVHGATPRRLWATAVAALGLVGVVVGASAFTRPAARLRPRSGRRVALIAMGAGLIAVVNGTLVVALAEGGPGSGNGVVGGAGALVLGVIALAFGSVALARVRPNG
jgi:hypothetical protein